MYFIFVQVYSISGLTAGITGKSLMASYLFLSALVPYYLDRSKIRISFMMAFILTFSAGVAGSVFYIAVNGIAN